MCSREQRCSIVSVWISIAVVLALGCGASGHERPPASSRSGSNTGSNTRIGRPPASGERWLELSTPHFIVHTDSYPERAIVLAKQLEQIRAMLLGAAWPLARDPGGRTHVVIFARPSDFNRFSGTTGRVVGVSITRSGLERTIAFSPGAEGGVPRVAVHELVHDLSQWFFPLQPAWFAEGLAVYLENTRLDAASGQVVMGEPSAESLRWMRSVKFFASTQKLFGATSPHSDDPRDVMTYYVGSWFLVTYLMNGESEAFGRFQKRLHQLVPWRRAWDEAFDGMTTEALDAKLQAYARQGGNISVMSIDVELPVIEPRLRALSPAEAHGVRAMLASAGDPAVAEREMRAALALDPGELNALSVRFRASGSEAPEPRRSVAERAVSAHPDAGEAWFLKAMTAPDASSRQSALERAAALDRGHPGVALLAAEDALGRGAPAAALEQVRFALRRSALTPRMLGLYAAALEATGQCSEAMSVAQNASAMFDADCSLRHLDTDERQGCAEYVQSKVGSPSAPCRTAKRAARTSAH
jgi:hypothetical protein